MDRKKIIKKGEAELKVSVGGIIQKHRFKVELEESPFGKVVYLRIDQDIDDRELVRLATEVDLPIKSKKSIAFPPGKMRKDFAGL